jgi:pimeloyl-ACP methyl ester carboxylesterase
VLNLTRPAKPAAFIGYDMGGAVAVGFAAKYPNLCASLALISPLGIKYKRLHREQWLNRKFFGEYLMMKRRHNMHLSQEQDFYDKSPDSPHRYLIERQAAMVQWQVLHTPGFLGAVLSTYRDFPMRSMDELFTAIGRHPRPTLNVWGDRDTICPYKKCIKVTEESFPKGIIVDIADCGHNVPFEKFEDVVKELLTFHKDAFDTLR